MIFSVGLVLLIAGCVGLYFIDRARMSLPEITWRDWFIVLTVGLGIVLMVLSLLWMVLLLTWTYMP